MELIRRKAQSACCLLFSLKANRSIELSPTDKTQTSLFYAITQGSAGTQKDPLSGQAYWIEKSPDPNLLTQLKWTQEGQPAIHLPQGASARVGYKNSNSECVCLEKNEHGQPPEDRIINLWTRRVRILARR
jgi:hypothetical protein